MAEIYIPSETQGITSREDEVRRGRELSDYRNTARSWVQLETQAAKENIKFNFLPEPKSTLGIKSKGNIFIDKNERQATLETLNKLRDNLIAVAQDKAIRYMDAGGVERLLKESKSHNGVLSRRAEQLRSLGHDQAQGVSKTFNDGQGIGYDMPSLEPVASLVSGIRKEAESYLAEDNPELAEAKKYNPGFGDSTPKEIKNKQALAEEKLGHFQAEALISWPPRLLKMAELLIGELTSLRGPETTQGNKLARPTELDSKLPVDPFNAILKKGMFDFAPTTIADLRKSLESMQGLYPKAILSRIDTQAEQHGLRWSGSGYEEDKTK